MKSLFAIGLWIPQLLLLGGLGALGGLGGGCALGAPPKCANANAKAKVTAAPKQPRRVTYKPTPRISKVVRLQHARAGEVASTLRRLDRGRQSLFDSRILATAYHHGNAVVLVGTAPDVAKVMRLVRKLDTPRRKIRLKVSLLEGTSLGKGKGKGKAKATGVGAGAAGAGAAGAGAAGAYRLTGQRVLDSTTITLADREERRLPLSPALRQRLGCLWGGKSPRLRLRAQVAPKGRILVTLSNVYGKRLPGPSSRRQASIQLSVANGKPVAIALTPKNVAARLPTSITLEAPAAKGFVLNARCPGRTSPVRLLVITPELVQMI